MFRNSSREEPNDEWREGLEGEARGSHYLQTKRLEKNLRKNSLRQCFENGEDDCPNVTLIVTIGCK